jgi:hypothetical protein
MDQDEIKTALASLHSLFKDVYVLNCQIDCDFANSTELKLIEDFDFTELVDNFKEIVLHLVTFKQDHAAQGGSRADQLEQLLQKVEEEVRQHIRVEQQLKLHIEALLAKAEATDREQRRMEEGYLALKAKLEQCEEEVLRLRGRDARTERRLKIKELKIGSSTPDAIGPLMMKSSKALHKKQREGTRPLGKQDQDLARLRAMLEAKDAECCRLRKLVKTSRVRHESAEARQEQVKSVLEHTENTTRRTRPKKSEVTRRSMGDLNQLVDPFGRRKDLKLDRLALVLRSSPARSSRSRPELSQRNLFPK